MSGEFADALDRLRAEIAAEEELARIKTLLDVPQQEDFLQAAVTEAQYQRTRWSASDEAKTDSDWFWLAGYLLGKALHDVRGKRVHHLTAAAAAIANWHAQALARGEHMPEDRGDQKDHAGRVVAVEVEDTLPRWLYQRFHCHCPGTYWIETYGNSADWNDLKPEDQAYWLHEAAAVRRAVARDGFKEKT